MEGYISQILRSVIDVHFLDADNKSQLPTINEVFTICRENGTVLIAEVQQHIVKRTVRAVAVDSTDGLRRHMKVVSSDNAISITVGEQIKGRLMNVTGENIDGMCPFDRMGAHLRFTANHRSSMSWPPRRRCYIPTSRSSTCWSPTSRATRSVCSATFSPAITSVTPTANWLPWGHWQA